MAETIDPNWTDANNIRLLIAYFNKIGLTKNLTLEQHYQKQQEYQNKYTVNEFKNKLKEFYDIKGEVTALKVTKAKKKTAENIPLEKEEQQKLCKWLKTNKIKHWANGLGVKLDYDVKYIASLRSQGHYKGIPDVTVLLPSGKVIFIELKRIKGGFVSPEQKKWIKDLQDLGYPARVCRGADEAIDFVEEELEKLEIEKTKTFLDKNPQKIYN